MLQSGKLFLYRRDKIGPQFYLPQVLDILEMPSLIADEQAKVVAWTETILLVEDEESVRALVYEALASVGFRVLAARHGAEALVISHQHQGHIHLLLMNVVLPEMSGRVLADRLAAQRPDMKVLYMSDYTDNTVVHQGILDLACTFFANHFRE